MEANITTITHSQRDDDKLLQAALFAADLPPLQDRPARRARKTTASAERQQAPASPTLGQLDDTRHPKASTVCEACPNSVWFASPAEVRCYCRVMFLLTWSSAEPQQTDKLRRPVFGAGKITVPGAAEQYIDEMERKRKADRSIRRHLLFSGAQRTLTLAGTRTVAGQGLALLRDGADMLVMPVDDATLRRLERQPAGARLDVSERGIAKPRGRSR